jgi:serine/threonine protein kinase
MTDYLSPGATLGPYSILKRLDSDPFSSLWHARHKQTTLPVVVKCFPRSLIASDALATRFTRELNLVQQMDHPFLAKLFEVIEEDFGYFLVFESVDGGSLSSLVSSQGALSVSRAQHIFGEIVLALKYLHNVSCVPHRDLRPEHVVFDTHGHVRLTDFGLSQIFSGKNAKWPSAPELLNGERYTTATDIWNAGMILAGMLNGSFGEVGKALPVRASDLVGRLLCACPAERPKLGQIAAHEWFEGTELPRLFQAPFASPGNRREITEMLISVGLTVDPDDLDARLNPELNTACLIVERRVLTQQGSFVNWEKDDPVKKERGPMTPTPIMHRRPVQVPPAKKNDWSGKQSSGPARSVTPGVTRALTPGPVCAVNAGLVALRKKAMFHQ